MKVVIVILVAIGILSAIASGIWVAIALISAISKHQTSTHKAPPGKLTK